MDNQENNDNVLDNQENNDIKPSITENNIKNDNNPENITPCKDKNNAVGINKTISGNMSNREVRYCHLKEFLNNNNYVCSTARTERYNRLKEILNRGKSKSIEQLKKDKIKSENEKNNLLFKNIEEFIKSKEKSKNNEKVLKDDIFNDNYNIIYVETEYDLICEFFNQIRKLDLDLIIGYNTFGFDYKYLGQRAGMYLNIDNHCNSGSPFTASRILTKPTKFVRTIDEDVELQIPGRIAIDMFKYAKSLNLASASLDYVSEQLLNKHKIDLPYKEMFYLIYENNEESLNKVAKYCIMDSILTLEIFNVSHQWIQLLEVAKTSRIRMDEIYKNGQSKKFANLLYKYCYDNDICIDEDRSSIQGYKGATVIEPSSGVYNYCTMLDFTNLYPSVIITHNICYTTLISKDKIKNYTEDSYHKIDIGGGKVYYFTKEHIGILPRMMKILLSERIRYKNLLTKSSGSDYIIYDKRQYALKIQANSIYGCLGSSSLKYLRFLTGAECTTGMGRNYLNKTIDLIHQCTNFKVIYGDTDSCLIEYKNNKNENRSINNELDSPFDSNQLDKFIKDSVKI